MCCSLLVLLIVGAYAPASSVAEQPIDSLQVLKAAEQRYTPPQAEWFYDAQQRLREEMARVEAALDAQGADYAQPWKNHFRWDVLTKNMASLDEVDVSEIALARRWMYSNRKGTEHPLFAELRTLADEYLDAAYCLSKADLQGEFREKIALARQQCRALAADPSDQNAAALGRTLGWFERTRQLPDEVAALRTMFSRPNLQVQVAKRLVSHIMATQDTSTKQSLIVSDRGTTPTKRRFQSPRTVYVHGVAHTEGTISLELVPNLMLAELGIVYEGTVNSHCQARSGPVRFKMKTYGSVSAKKPVTFGPQGLELGSTDVAPAVHTNVTGVYANSNFARRIGTRRVYAPESRAAISQRAREKAADLIRDEMDDRVEEAVDEIRTEIRRMRSSFSRFAEVLAPVIREGAAPRFAGTSSTQEEIVLKIAERRREQLGAATDWPVDLPTGDVSVRVHVSFINNLLETIMSGKKFTDEYFMKYAKVLQPTLPLPLMVHARAPRWAIVADSPRPFELTIPEPNMFHITLNIATFELDGVRYDARTSASLQYELVKNEFGEYFLLRTHEVVLESKLATDQRDFLRSKLDAFFAATLDGGGVLVPDGGALGQLKELEFVGVLANENWLGLACNVPASLVQKLIDVENEDPQAELPEKSDVPPLPPPFSVDESLSSYPTGLD